MIKAMDPHKRIGKQTVLKILDSLNTGMEKLRKDFEGHVKDETPRLQRIEEGVLALNRIKLNGDERIYTQEEAFRELFSIVKQQRIRRDFQSRWKALRDSSPILHFIFATKWGRVVLLGLAVYFAASLMEDFGLFHESPLQLMLRIVKSFIPRSLE